MIAILGSACGSSETSSPGTNTPTIPVETPIPTLSVELVSGTSGKQLDDLILNYSAKDIISRTGN